MVSVNIVFYRFHSGKTSIFCAESAVFFRFPFSVFFFVDYIYLEIGRFHLDFSLIRKNGFLIVILSSFDTFSLAPEPK